MSLMIDALANTKPPHVLCRITYDLVSHGRVSVRQMIHVVGSDVSQGHYMEFVCVCASTPYDVPRHEVHKSPSVTYPHPQQGNIEPISIHLWQQHKVLLTQPVQHVSHNL